MDGVTAYPADALAGYTADLIGPAVPVSRIEAARAAILQKYRADGYVLSAVSARVDPDGTLRFLVTEGHIDAVKLDHDIGPAGTQVLRFLQRLTEVKPVDEKTLERYLLLAGDVPGVTVRAVLQPSADEPGALTLIAQVSRSAVTGIVATDNYASRYTGPIETLGAVNLNSFSEYGERTQLSLYQAWPNSQTFGQAQSDVFLGSSGLKARVYAGSGPVNPTGPLSQEGYKGTTTVFGAALYYPVIRVRSQSLNVFGSLDGEDSDVSIDTGGARTPASEDSLRILRVGADYALSDIFAGGERPAVNAANLRLSKGLDILGASPNGSSNPPRPNVQNDFVKIDGQVSRTQTLFAPWEGASVALLGLLAGQWSGDILPPIEQFYLGGLQLTRGYYAGQITGDKALAATGEMQLNVTTNLARIGLSETTPTQYYLFYDWGETWQNAAASQATRVASTGGGVRMTLSRNLDFDLLGVARLNRYPAGTGPNVSPIVGGAFLWRAVARF